MIFIIEFNRNRIENTLKFNHTIFANQYKLISSLNFLIVDFIIIIVIISKILLRVIPKFTWAFSIKGGKYINRCISCALFIMKILINPKQKNLNWMCKTYLSVRLSAGRTRWWWASVHHSLEVMKSWSRLFMRPRCRVCATAWPRGSSVPYIEPVSKWR